MEQPVHNLLAGWESFYVIVGSVAGALIGLQFVVMALVAESRRRATTPEIAAFGTPTVLHFSAALLVAALSSVPWTAMSGLQFSLAACGVAGIAYAIVVVRRASRTQRYRPQLEDWVWHAALPFAAYAALAVAGAILSRNAQTALSLVAGATLLLVFIGIHNSWDSITYIATEPGYGATDSKRPGGEAGPG